MILIALTHLADALNVSRSAITQLSNKKLKDAVSYKEGNKVLNIGHPLFKAHYKIKQKDTGISYEEFIDLHKDKCFFIETQQEVEQQAIEKRKTGLDNATILTKNQVDELGHLTLGEIAEQYGTQYNFNLQLEGYKELLNVQKLANQVCKQRGELIDAELLTKTVKGYLDALAGGLLNDFTNWAAQEVAALTDCNKDNQLVLVDKFKGEISRQLKSAQARIIKDIEKAQSL